MPRSEWVLPALAVVSISSSGACTRDNGTGRSDEASLEYAPNGVQAAREAKSAVAEQGDDAATTARMRELAKQGQWSELEAIATSALAESDDDRVRLELGRTWAGLLEEGQDPGAAFEVWLRFYLESPDHPEVVQEVERLAERTHDWHSIADAGEQAARSDWLSEEQRVRALRHSADILRTRLGDPRRAARLLGQILELKPDDPRALAALKELGPLDQLPPPAEPSGVRFVPAERPESVFTGNRGFSGAGVYVASQGHDDIPDLTPDTLVLVRTDGEFAPISVLLPAEAHANRWRFSLPGKRVDASDPWLSSLVAVPSEGFYRLRADLHFGDDGNWQAGAVVQLGYGRSGRPMLFIAQHDENGANSLFFGDGGVAIRRDQLRWLDPLAWYEK